VTCSWCSTTASRPRCLQVERTASTTSRSCDHAPGLRSCHSGRIPGMRCRPGAAPDRSIEGAGVDVFDLRDDLIGAYREYATSFMRIRDGHIRARVDEALREGRLWPPPQIGLNPAFHPGGTIDELVAEGLLHPDAASIFRVGKSAADAVGQPMTLHQHQVDAIRAARAGRNYVLTTGTGSGKSLSYIVPIVDHVLRTGAGTGAKAVVVYPMNALANSQLEELDKYLAHGPWGPRKPVTYARYTGQEDEESRRQIQRQPPDILLTNYVMLELILTRYYDRSLVDQLRDLRFL